MSSSVVTFKPEEVAKAQAHYETLEVTPAQREIIRQVAALLTPKIPWIPELALRGYVSYAVRDWQFAHNRPATDLGSFTPSERVAAVREMFQFFATALKKSLVSQHYAGAIQQAVDAGLDFYARTFSQRQEK